MCGIAAGIDLDGRGRALPWALERLRHRGPDGEGTLTDGQGNVALEHTRLAIIDPENEEADQPFCDPSGRYAMVYNGEVFNFREIRRELEARGIRFRTESDTEVVLLGYIAQGEAILRRLRGMFAFVVWDRETGDVFAARDQIGVKPLYYAVRDGLFLAGSEVRALLAHPLFRPRLDAAGVVEYLAFGLNPSERTVVDDVRKLLPGHCLHVSNGRVTVSEYWDVIPPDEDRPTGETPAEELLARLDEAVAAALVSDVPLGLMLSGGVDSSAVAALAVRHVPAGELTAYSVAFGRADDEAAAAARLADDVGLRHREIRVTEAEVRADFDGWLSDLDYPCGDPTWIASSFIARAAHADGIKVLLSGDGGDELFGGYTRWMKYLRFHDRVWARTPRPVRRMVGTGARPLVRGLAQDIARRAAAGGELFVPSRPFHDDVLARCLGPAGVRAAAATPPEEFVGAMRRRLHERLPDADYLTWMSYVTLRTKLVEDFLQRLDKMGMRHSVEGRVPLLDPHVARWAVAAPQAVTVPGYRQKAVLRDAVAPVLPAYVLERPKQGFCPPVVSWAEELLLRKLPEGGPLVESGLLSGGAVEYLRSRGHRVSFASWTLGVLLEWANRNLESAAPPVLEVAA